MCWLLCLSLQCSLLWAPSCTSPSQGVKAEQIFSSYTVTHYSVLFCLVLFCLDYTQLPTDLHLYRNIIKRLVPQQGDGPSQDMLDNGYLQIGFWGKGTGAGGEEVVVKGGVYALHGDPGYRYCGSAGQ